MLSGVFAIIVVFRIATRIANRIFISDSVSTNLDGFGVPGYVQNTCFHYYV